VAKVGTFNPDRIISLEGYSAEVENNNNIPGKGRLIWAAIQFNTKITNTAASSVSRSSSVTTTITLT
jgi:hypothetical protein